MRQLSVWRGFQNEHGRFSLRVELEQMAVWNGTKPEGLLHPLPGSKAPVCIDLKRKGLKGRHINSKLEQCFGSVLSMCQPFGLFFCIGSQPVVITTGRGCNSLSGFRMLAQLIANKSRIKSKLLNCYL